MAFDPKAYKKPSKDEIKKMLDSEQYRCSQGNGTETPFSNKFWDHHEAGIYVDVVSGEPLFSSLDKFDSKSGWPSFTRPLEIENVVRKPDHSGGMARVEVRSKYGDGHLGHVFEDGPRDRGGKRYCINSASLRFIPVKDLQDAGLGQYLKLFNK